MTTSINTFWDTATATQREVLACLTLLPMTPTDLATLIGEGKTVRQLTQAVTALRRHQLLSREFTLQFNHAADREVLFRRLLREGALPALFDRLDAAVEGMSRWNKSYYQRQVDQRRALAGGPVSAFFAAEPSHEEIAWVTEPWDPAFIDQLPPTIRSWAIANLLDHNFRSAQPTRHLGEMLALDAHILRIAAIFGGAERVYRGDLPGARALAEHTPRAGMGAQLHGLIDLAAGDLKAAEKHLAAWMATQRKIEGNQYVPQTIAGVFVPLVYALSGKVTRIKQCKTLIERGEVDRLYSSNPLAGWAHLRPLLDPSANGGRECTHPVAVLHHALAAAWTDQIGPTAPVTDAAIATCARLGWTWLETELRAASGQDVDAIPGGAHLISLRKRVSRWEQVLDALDKQVPATAAGAPASDRRLAWRLWHKDGALLTLEARDQKRTKSGWTVGKKIALSRVRKGLTDVSHATDADRLVAASLREETEAWGYHHRSGWTWREETVWPALAEHPCVLFEDTNDPLTIVQRPPRITVKRARGGRRVTLEPRSDANVVLTPVGAHGVEFTVLSAADRAVAKALGPKGVLVPTAGKAALETTLARLRGTYEVVDGTSPTELAGDPTPVLQITRRGDASEVRLRVRPAGEDGPALTPGEGAAVVLSRIPSGTRRIARDLTAEQTRADDVLDDEAVGTVLSAADWQDDHWVLDDLTALLELLDAAAQIRDLVTLEWASGTPLNVKRAKGLSLTVTSTDEWLQVSGDLQVDDDHLLAISDVIARVGARRDRFVALGDDAFVAISERLARRLDALERARRGGRGKAIAVHTLAAETIEGLLDEATTVTTDDGWREALRNAHAPLADVPVPAGLTADLRPYQVDGFRWLSRLASWGAGACLADDMGLGKTVQTLALLLSRASDGPALVVAPTSVCAGWRDEAWRFAPGLQVLDLRDGDRAATLNALGPGHLLTCSYGLLVSERERLSEIAWSTVVLDESQAIKNAATQRHKAALSLSARFRLSLTGTPIENHVEELRAQIAFLAPGFLGGAARFRKHFARPIADGDRDALRQLRRLVRPIVLRRTKSEVLEDLPTKTVIDVPVTLSQAGAALYEGLRRDAVAASADVSERGRFQLLAHLTKLRLAACHPQLVDPDAGPDSAKLDALGHIVDGLHENHHRVLVFSQFVRHLDLVAAWLKAKDISTQRLDGSTSAQERARRVAAFQAGEGDVFLISLRAGGFGLNLTGADYVVHLDPWWNPAVENQASDRAHRIGQTRPVTVYRLVAKGTVEERILALQHGKQEVADALLEGASAAGSLSPEALRDLLLDPVSP